MLNSKLLKLLMTFSKAEAREFGLFLRSPVYNGEKVLVNFYTYLKRHYPEFKSVHLSKEKIYLKLFPGKRYNDPLMRNTISDMLKLAERFLKIYHFENDKFYSQYLLLKELTDRKQYPLFKVNFKKADSILHSESARDEIYYQNRFLLEDEWRRNHVVNSSRMLFETDNLRKQSESLHIYYITEFIKLYAIMLNQSRSTYDYNFDFTLFETLTKYLENNFSLYRDVPYINIFYNCVKLYKTGELKYFEELKLLQKKHHGILTFTDRKNIFIVLLSYCEEQIKKGNYVFADEKFRINEYLLKTKDYLEGNNFMPHYLYESISNNAVDCREFTWAENFINKYRKILHPEFKDNSYNICISELFFNLGLYNKSLESLSLVIPADIKHRIKINVLLLKIFYCTNVTDSFYSLIESSRKYILRNKKVQETSRMMYSNFLNFINKLYKIKNDDKLIPELKTLRNNILCCNDLFSKKWILDSVDKLADS